MILNEPVVTVDRSLLKLDTVVLKPGYRENARQMMHHLFALGHQRIGFIYGVATPTIELIVVACMPIARH